VHRGAADVVPAAEHLRDHFAAPTLLIGHGLGGAAVLAATQVIPGVRAVVTFAGPQDEVRQPDDAVALGATHRRRDPLRP
jgi:predicted alpha/beta hydrolase family esterase